MPISTPDTFAAFLDELAAYQGQTIVIKIGGNSIDEDPTFLPSLAAQVHFLLANGVKPVVVHGGGPQIDRALEAKGFSRAKAADGRRITTPAMMEVVAKVMAEISETVAEAFEETGSTTFCAGRSDLCFVKAKPLVEGHSADEDRTGLPSAIDSTAIRVLLDGREIVVMSSLGRDGDHHDYNINADDCAMDVAIALHAKRLILATNVDGVLDNAKNLIPQLNEDLAQRLIAEGVISGGMIPKVQSALAALNQGVGGVAILNAHQKGSILAELLSREGIGTLIAKS